MISMMLVGAGELMFLGFFKQGVNFATRMIIVSVLERIRVRREALPLTHCATLPCYLGEFKYLRH